MDASARIEFLRTIRNGLELLPKWAKHDLWRRCEPQHQQAIERIADDIAARVEERFKVEPLPPANPKPVGWV